MLRRLRAVDDPDYIGPGGIEVGTASGGSVMIEWGGYAGIMRDVVRDLSAGAVIASVKRNVNWKATFLYAVDGQVRARFDPMYRGYSPTRHPDDQLLDGEYPDMIPDYQDPGDGFIDRHLQAALALAEHRTGVRLEPRHLRSMPSYASIAHYYSPEHGGAPELA
ncbi:DUF6461 domain-containing protein [[Actinomadura] parvosata]|uniref:DUF6461 domain-containing protein n=1 Tax=[Actinomadura] parvosata TaxID=1955412 RepID=UPI00406D12E2